MDFMLMSANNKHVKNYMNVSLISQIHFLFICHLNKRKNESLVRLIKCNTVIQYCVQ